MTENWDKHAGTWDRDERVHFYADSAFSSLITHVNIHDGAWRSKRGLDFGCGTGLLTEKLAPLFGEIIAIDTSQNMIDVLRQKGMPNVTEICADIDDPAVRSAVPWPGGYDLVVASSVCGFLPNYEMTIDVLSQALKVSGYFVQWDWLSSEDEPGMTMDIISEAFESAGLDNVHVGAAFSVVFDGKEMPVVMGVARRKS